MNRITFPHGMSGVYKISPYFEIWYKFYTLSPSAAGRILKDLLKNIHPCGMIDQLTGPEKKAKKKLNKKKQKN